MILLQVLLIPLVLFLMLAVVFVIGAMGVDSSNSSTTTDPLWMDAKEGDASHHSSPALPTSS